MINITTLRKYQGLKDELARLKTEEMEVRKQICFDLLDGKAPGTHNMMLSGCKVKAVSNLNYKVDAEILNAIYSSMSEEEQECISFKPSLSRAKYKDLDSDNPMLDEAIIVTDAAPSLTIILPEDI